MSEVPDYQSEQLKRRVRSNHKLGRRAWFSKTLALLAPPALASGYSRYESTWLEVTQTRLALSDLPKGRKIKILHLSDLHLSQTVSAEDIDQAFQEGLKGSPHACMITGDFITDQPSAEKLQSLGNCLAKYSAKLPIFACLGNHDGGSWAANHGGFPTSEKVSLMLRESRVRLLHNQRVSVMLNRTPITLIGVGDLWSRECLPMKCLSKKVQKQASPSPLNLVLCHNPDAKEILRPFDWDLMLCGHTHGGQLRIPFTNYAPLAPVKDLSMTEGLHALDGRSIYITRGVGSLYGLRINCRPEASLLELTNS
jgi:predicted MPP superfamily phosphohydrolase